LFGPQNPREPQKNPRVKNWSEKHVGAIVGVVLGIYLFALMFPEAVNALFSQGSTMVITCNTGVLHDVRKTQVFIKVYDVRAAFRHAHPSSQTANTHCNFKF